MANLSKNQILQVAPWWMFNLIATPLIGLILIGGLMKVTLEQGVRLSSLFPLVGIIIGWFWGRMLAGEVQKKLQKQDFSVFRRTIPLVSFLGVGISPGQQFLASLILIASWFLFFYGMASGMPLIYSLAIALAGALGGMLTSLGFYVFLFWNRLPR